MKCRRCGDRKPVRYFDVTPAGNPRKVCKECYTRSAKELRNARRDAESEAAVEDRKAAAVVAASPEARLAMPDPSHYVGVTAAMCTPEEWALVVGEMVRQAQMGKVTAAEWLARRMIEWGDLIEKERKAAGPGGVDVTQSVRSIAQALRAKSPGAARALGLELLKEVIGDE